MNRPDYITISLWGRKADLAKKMVRRGDNLVVSGSVYQERWKTKNHENRNRTVIQADKFWKIVDDYFRAGRDEEYEEDEYEELDEIDKEADDAVDEIMDKAQNQFDSVWGDAN